MARRPPVSSDRRFRRKESSDDLPPPERWQHAGRLLTQDKQGKHLVVRVLEECVLDHLHLMGRITSAQKKTGLRLRGDFVCAGLVPHVTRPYAQRMDQNSFRHERSPAQENAYERWRRALRAVDLFYTDSVVSVCCYDAMPIPAHFALLQMGLAQLEKWYGECRGRHPREGGDHPPAGETHTNISSKVPRGRF